MLSTLTLLAALVAPARADDQLTLEATVQARPDEGGAVGTGGAIRFDVGSLILSAEGRALGQGAWIGRATGALDLLGGSERFDLTAGAFAGMTGGIVPEFGPTPTYGLELGVGVHIERFEARYRRAMGLTGPLSGLLSEDELRAGLRLGEERRLYTFAQAVYLRAGQDADAIGLGAGVACSF